MNFKVAMERGFVIAGIVLATVAAAVEPKYSKHDYIGGNVLILTNTQEWVEDYVGEQIEKSSQATNIAEVAKAATNYTDSVKSELSFAIGTNASDIAALKTDKANVTDMTDADAVVLNNAKTYTDTVSSNALEVVMEEANSIRKDFSESIASLDIVPVEMPAAAASNGVTFVDAYGENANVAISIGRNAKAGVTTNALDAAKSNTVVRSVSIAIGAESDATESDTSTKNQAIAIGWHAQARGSNAIAIGSGAQHPTETAETGDATYANGSTTIAVGYSAKAMDKAAIAIGNLARATAENAVQLGAGTNTEKNTLKFQNVTIVKDGKIAAVTDTNAVEQTVTETLDPKVVTTAEPSPDYDAEIICRSHSINTLAFTNSTAGMEVGLYPTGTRNYEVYIPNTESMRAGLPISMITAVEDAILLGSWWTNKIMTLPVKVRIIEPIEKTLIAEVELYDDKWDWTPVVVSATLKGGYVSVVGTNLHMVAKYQINSDAIKPITNPLYATLIISETAAAGDILKLYNSQDAKVAEVEIVAE